MKTPLVLTALLLTACTKEKTGFGYERITLPVSAKARCIEPFGDSLVIAGGDVGGRGFVVVCDAGLSAFEVRTHSLKHEVYAAKRYKGTWYFGLDSTAIATSTDLRSFAPHPWQQSDWVSYLSQHPIRRFSAVGDNLFAAAGGKLAFGVVYHTSDSGASWHPSEYDHEMRTVFSVGDASAWTAWAGGNGLFLKKTSANSAWQSLRLEDTFMADLHFYDEKNGLLVTYEGEIRATDDGGTSWTVVDKMRKQRAVNRMVAAGDDIVVAANAGVFAYSPDRGRHFRWHKLDEPLDLSDAHISAQDVFFTAKGGTLIRVSLAALQ